MERGLEPDDCILFQLEEKQTIPKENFLLLISHSCFIAGLYRLRGAYDATSDVKEMRKEKEEADKKAKISILSLVGVSTGRGLVVTTF